MKNEKVKILELLIHLVIIIFLVLATTRPVGAQSPAPSGAGQGVMKSGEATAGASVATEGAKKKSEYQLPYPGILPDHPLYVLKVVRDRIIDLLIADPLKKAEFTLLAGEKRITSAQALVEKGKGELAESTASKGQSYLERSIALYKQAKGKGKDVSNFANKLSASLAKQEEVLVGLQQKTSGNVKDRFATIADNVSQYRYSLQFQE